MTIILIGIVGTFASIIVLLVLRGVRQGLEPAEEIDERIEEWVQQRGQADSLRGKEPGESRSVFLGQVEKTIARRSFADGLRADLAQADLSLRLSEYLVLRALVIVLFFLLGYAVQRQFIAGILLALVGFFLPQVYVSWRQARRLTMFNNQLPDVLSQMVGSLRAGYGLMQTAEWIANQMPDPSATEFERVLRETRLGRSLMEAFDNMVRRIPSDDLAFVVTAIKIQHESGGSLADILATVEHTIRERNRVQREINVLTAQQRYSGYVLMVLPIALAIVLFLLAPDYMSQLIEPGPTLCIPIGAAVLMIVGFFLMRRIVDIEV
jgi:tight adherence protein B